MTVLDQTASESCLCVRMGHAQIVVIIRMVHPDPDMMSGRAGKIPCHICC